MSKQIAEILREYRVKKGITQIELAKRLGISYNCISQWECGYREASLLTTVRCMSACGYSQDQAIIVWANAHLRKHLNRHDLEFALVLNRDRNMLVFEDDITVNSKEDEDLFDD